MSDKRHNLMKSWMERAFVIDGVLATGGGCGDTAFSVFSSGELVMANSEEVWQAIAGNILRAQSTGIPSTELLWGFEQALLRTVQREDGTWLGVFTVPKLSTASALAMRARLDEFLGKDFAVAA